MKEKAKEVIKQERLEHARASRFMRKALSNYPNINYYVSITKDPDLFISNDEWLAALCKYFAECATRYGIMVMGVKKVFEKCDHVHFCGFANLTPEYLSKQELEKTRTRPKSYAIPFIREKFGINNFYNIKNSSPELFMGTVKSITRFGSDYKYINVDKR